MRKLQHDAPHDLMTKGIDQSDVSAAYPIVDMDDGDCDHLGMTIPDTPEQGQTKIEVRVVLSQDDLVLTFAKHREEVDASVIQSRVAHFIGRLDAERPNDRVAQS